MMNVSSLKLERSMAMLDFEEGRLPEAEARLGELIDSMETAESPVLKDELCKCLTDRSTVRRYSNRWQEALDDLSLCETLATTLKALARNANLHTVYMIRAKLLTTPFTSVYDLDKARAALDELRRVGSNDWVIDEMEGNIAFHARQWRKAAELYRDVAQALTALGWQRGAMSCRLRAGLASLELGERQRAEAETAPAEEFFEKYGPPDQLAAVQMARARIHAAAGEHDLAWEAANRALQGVESLIRHFRSLFEQQRFVLDKIENYYHAFQIGLAKGGKQGWLRAWTVAERAKSFYLCQLVANADVSLFEGVDPDQIAQLRDLELQLDLCDLNGSQEGDAGRQAELEEQLQLLSMKKQALLGKMMKANPRWAALRTPPALDLEAEFTRLGPPWIPLSYFFYPKDEGATLYIFYAGPDREPCCLQTDWSSEELAQLDQSREKLRGRLPAHQSLFPDELVEKVLPTALIESMEPGWHLLVSPHDRLRAIPLHALTRDEGERLIDRCPVQYIPTLALLPLRRHETVTHPSAVLLMGCEQNNFLDPPLEEVVLELQGLREVWQAKRPGRVEHCLIEQNGSPAEAGLPPEMWRNFEFVHVACHGVFPEEQPLNAALRLGDEAMRASEFFHTRLDAKLVSLSACSLGRQMRREAGIDLRGDEWIGLYLPMFYAGIQTLLVSLWDANTRVAVTFMTTLHRALGEGASPVEAFQEAQQQVKSKPDPLWANWYLVGFPD